MQSLFKFLSITLVVLVATDTLAAQNSNDTVRTENFSLSRGKVALSGYDPVSYWSVKGPQKGSKKITTTYKGVTYHFGSKENKSMFLSTPEKFEPQYGGWCAWAMLDGGRTKPDPESYKLIDNKLYLYYDGLFGDTRSLWNEEIQTSSESSLVKKANQQWLNQLKG